MAKLLTRDKSYYRGLISLAIPAALQNLITFCVGFADNLMVNTLGDNAVSGVYIGSQIQTLLQMFTSGVGGAIVIIAAQYWGRRDTAQIKKLSAIGLRFATLAGVAFTVIGLLAAEPISRFFTDDPAVIEQSAVYLQTVCWSYAFFCMTQTLLATMRAVETVKVGMYVSSISLFANIGLNYILIFGKLGISPMGVKGAAIATVIARAVETAVIALYIAFVDKKLAMRVRDLFSGDKLLRKDFVRYGIPLMLGEIVWSVNMMMNSRILGHYGASVITATSVANTMNSLAFIFIGGLATAVGVITGKTVGAGKTELMKEYARTTEILFLSLGLFLGMLVAVLNRPFVALYGGVSAEAAEESVRFIHVLTVSIMGTCYQMPCLFGLVKSGGDISFVFKNDTLFVFLVVLPSALIASHFNASPWIVFACLKSDQVLKCVVAFFKIRRYDWMKKLTRETEGEKAAL